MEEEDKGAPPVREKSWARASASEGEVERRTGRRASGSEGDDGGVAACKGEEEGASRRQWRSKGGSLHTADGEEEE
jgi:hypothetical protein